MAEGQPCFCYPVETDCHEAAIMVLGLDDGPWGKPSGRVSEHVGLRVGACLACAKRAIISGRYALFLSFAGDPVGCRRWLVGRRRTLVLRGWC